MLWKDACYLNKSPTMMCLAKKKKKIAITFFSFFFFFWGGRGDYSGCTITARFCLSLFSFLFSSVSSSMFNLSYPLIDLSRVFCSCVLLHAPNEGKGEMNLEKSESSKNPLPPHEGLTRSARMPHPTPRKPSHACYLAATPVNGAAPLSTASNVIHQRAARGQ